MRWVTGKQRLVFTSESTPFFKKSFPSCIYSSLLRVPILWRCDKCVSPRRRWMSTGWKLMGKKKKRSDLNYHRSLREAHLRNYKDQTLCWTVQKCLRGGEPGLYGQSLFRFETYIRCGMHKLRASSYFDVNYSGFFIYFFLLAQINTLWSQHHEHVWIRYHSRRAALSNLQK